ncbi:MAG: hypothetical protein JXQ65_04705 [Candidatus Marinimicrobia bacterium]|nr:hypothetical protein [Candidatus Neomarinimicrobiota bacterium]
MDKILFKNNDEFLLNSVKEVVDERKKAGLENLIGGLESIIINVEPEKFEASIQELLNYTGYGLKESYENDLYQTTVLGLDESADILVRARKSEDNPFREFNIAPKSRSLPNTRLETFVFRCDDVKKYYDIQSKRGVEFLSNEINETSNYYFIQTKPSKFTGISIGLVQWKKDGRIYKDTDDEKMELNLLKPAHDYLENIKKLDHTATRVKATDRDAAILEFMNLTNYNFEFAIYVKSFNSITNVARLSDKDFAMVFTSGISPYKNEEESGPTEKFIHNYNTRTHHLAFVTENIEDTFQNLKCDGMDFLVELVGSPEEGLKQTFSETSKHTFLVNEYIHRYGDFTGFFTRNNVTLLTESTSKQ